MELRSLFTSSGYLFSFSFFPSSLLFDVLAVSRPNRGHPSWASGPTWPLPATLAARSVTGAHTHTHTDGQMCSDALGLWVVDKKGTDLRSERRSCLVWLNSTATFRLTLKASQHVKWMRACWFDSFRRKTDRTHQSCRHVLLVFVFGGRCASWMFTWHEF